VTLPLSFVKNTEEVIQNQEQLAIVTKRMEQNVRSRYFLKIVFVLNKKREF
jgi:hypothetical protein